MSNVVYLGHVPDGFIERDMWKYLSQFGAIKRLKLFRSRKTGRSKGFAFVQFFDADVAKIVSTTMNNYLMFDKIIKCHVVPKEKLHQNMFKNWQKIRQPATFARKIVEKRNKVKTNEQILAMRQRLAAQIEKQNKKLADFGINYSFPVTWANVKDEVKDEIKEETDSIDGDASWANDTAEIVSEYSMIVDSSDDEVALKTPEKAVKRAKVDGVQTQNLRQETIADDPPKTAVKKKVRFSLSNETKKSPKNNRNKPKIIQTASKSSLKNKKPKATKKKFKIKKKLSKKDKARNKSHKMFK